MPNPTNSDVHVDAALSTISVAYMQAAENFAASRAFPIVPVDKQSDKYHTYNKNDFLRDEARKRAPATESAGGGYSLSTGSYFADVWAFHKDVPGQATANEDDVLNGEADATEFCAQKILIRREREFASNFMTTGVWGTDVVGGTNFTKWDDVATSDPIEDIKDGRIIIAKNTGIRPNKLVVGFDVHEALKIHPLIVERFKYVSADSITPAMIARILELDEYIVSSAVYATNEEGGTAAYDFVVGKNALLCHTANAPSRMTPSAGYIFGWRGLTGMNDVGVRTKRIDMPKLDAVRIETEAAFDMKMVSADLGYFFSAAVS